MTECTEREQSLAMQAISSMGDDEIRQALRECLDDVAIMLRREDASEAAMLFLLDTYDTKAMCAAYLTVKERIASLHPHRMEELLVLKGTLARLKSLLLAVILIEEAA